VTTERAEAVAATEVWFVRHGLPYFVESQRRVAARGLTRARLVPALSVALGLGAAAGVLVGWLAGDASAGLTTGLAVTGVAAALYAGTILRVHPIARWAGVRTLRSLGLLFPLVTRALPLLLLFVTFLFINTEVWQVATSLDRGVLALAVMFFGALAVGFLLVRLPEELDRVDDEAEGVRLVAACKGTPLEQVAPTVAAETEFDVVRDVEVTGYQKANLILVLLVSQIVQVLLLSLAVFLFFVTFGSVVMQRNVVESWISFPPHPVFGWPPGLTIELVQVSVFLAAFSGLYFTVYAVTDGTYREQFFTAISRELERAVGVRAVYTALKREAGPG
jgi:hypothetical protein